jgi:hypothetical protein
MDLIGFPLWIIFLLAQITQTCPQSLLALLWITCSLYPAGFYLRGLERSDQKTTNIHRKVPTGISHGFYWFFTG